MKDDSVYLIHVLECIKQIEEYTIQLAIDTFKAQIPDKAFYNSTGTVIKVK